MTGPNPAAFTPPSPAELAKHFPQLEIVELLGQGGMGAVYKARQVKLDRLVAVKILPPEWGKDPAFAERFTREARALARLSHPHIVAVHDFGEADGLFYLVMEYVDGVNLRELLRDGSLRPGDALKIVPQVCDALDYAHGEGVVHRDIKPENILLDQKWRVKIADFGLAKLLNRPAAALNLTASHQVVGTLDYMAPEQRLRPLEVDHRADIYSLGVVFYEMLTGELPLGRFAPPSRKVPIDQRLDDIVFRALEREPGQRYQRISEVKSDLESITRRNNVRIAAAPPPDVLPSEASPDFNPLRVIVPASGLLLTAILSFVFWTILGFALAFEGRRSQEGFLLLPLLAIPASGVIFAGAIRMMQFRSYTLAVVASMWAMIPWSPAWVLGLPFGIKALKSLRKHEVQAAFNAPAWCRRGTVLPALGLILTGVAAFLFWAFLGVLLAAETRRNGEVFLLMPVLAAPAALILAFGGMRMLQSRSYSLSVVASMWAMVPWSPAWVIGLPFGIWAICALRRPEVQATFDLPVRPSWPPARVPPPPPPDEEPPEPPLPARRGLRSFLLSVQSMFISSPGRDDRER